MADDAQSDTTATQGDQQVTPAPAAEAQQQATEPPTKDDLGEAGKRALDTEREARKTAERELKALKAQLDKSQREQMGEQERQVADAEARGRATAVQDIGSRWIAAELRALAAEAGADAAQTEFWDMRRFATDDGEPNLKAIAEAVDKLPKKTPAQPEPPKVPSLDGGVQPPAKAKTSPGLGTLQYAYAQSERKKS